MVVPIYSTEKQFQLVLNLNFTLGEISFLILQQGRSYWRICRKNYKGQRGALFG